MLSATAFVVIYAFFPHRFQLGSSFLEVGKVTDSLRIVDYSYGGGDYGSGRGGYEGGGGGGRGRGGPPRGGGRPRQRDDKVHDSIIEERIQRERPCRTLFIRNIKASVTLKMGMPEAA